VPKDGAVFVACPPAIGLLFRDYIVYYIQFGIPLRRPKGLNWDHPCFGFLMEGFFRDLKISKIFFEELREIGILRYPCIVL